ncbi:MAG TPA: hypothetical protein VFY45_17150 [Baekduia sp.]|nr:hypothetical protein [Baekduia sp.]
MNDADSASPGDEVPQVPGHLRAVLGAAAREELEFASDGCWPDDGDEYDAMLDRLTRAVYAIERWEAGTCTGEEVAKLAAVAVGMQEPARWPRTLREADDVLNRARLTRDLIVLRDALGGKRS